MKFIFFLTVCWGTIQCTSSRPFNETMFPYGDKAGDTRYPTYTDDGFQGVRISHKIPFFDKLWDYLYVSTNGIISFGVGIRQFSTRPFPLGNGWTIISPFWEDIDIRRGGMIYYRETTDQELLDKVSRQVNQAVPGMERFKATWMFINTNDRVASFKGSTIPRNTFQLVLATNSYYTFALFNYANIEWYDNNGGGAQVGFNAGDGKRFFAVPGSRTSEMKYLENSTNIDVPGRWVFRVDGGTIETIGCDDVENRTDISISPRFVPLLGGTELQISGPCFEDNNTTFCKFGDNLVTKAVFESKNIIRCVAPNLLYSYDKESQVEDIEVRVSVTNGTNFTMEGRISVLDERFYKADVDFIFNSNSSEFEIRWPTDKVETNDTNIDLLVMAEEDGPRRKRFIAPRQQIAISLAKGYLNKGVIRISKAVMKDSLSAVKKRIVAIGVAVKEKAIEGSKYLVSEVKAVGKKVYKAVVEWPSSVAIGKCVKWSNKQTSDWLKDLPPSPCTLAQALNDPNFQSDPACNPSNECTYHPGAFHCFRSARPTKTGSCTQSCYTKDGKLMINSGGRGSRQQGGGTADRYCAKFGTYWEHWLHDVYSYMACCVLSKSDEHCSLYHKHRPSDDCSGYVPPRTARGGGDPHITTLDGKAYSFNGIGEYTLLKTTDGIINIQGRTIQATRDNGRTVSASVWQAIAVKARWDTAQIEVDEIKGVLVYLNQTETNFREFPYQNTGDLTEPFK